MESNDNLTIIYPNVSFDNEVDDKVELSAVFPSYRIIKLETLPESLIGGPNTKVIKHGNMFYVRSINEVLVFDEDGKFVKKLSRLGSGPSEYARVLDFDVVGDGRNELWVSAEDGIHRYDLNTLNYKGKMQPDFYVSRLKYIGHGSFIADTPEDEVFKIIDMAGNVESSFFKKDLANSLTMHVDFI